MTAADVHGAHATRTRSIALLAVAQVAALALWFSTTAALPGLLQQRALSPWTQSLFTSAVQLGFVIGSLVSTALGLADRLDPRRFFAVSALVGAAANGLIVTLDPASPLVIALRLVTGVALAGVYPVGMKMVASWAEGDLGLLVGLLVGALTLGSALPHLFNSFGGVAWQTALLMASASAIVAAGLVFGVAVGPRFAKGAGFRRELIWRAWDDKPIRLAILGYLGHMWELYAVWAWIGVFFLARLQAESQIAATGTRAALASFAVIAAGALGCLFGGWIADRWGRTRLTALSMAISGACCILAGVAWSGPLWALMALSLVWGFFIVSDSAQFSSCVAELADAGMVGTMLTLQTALGFTLTLATIHLMPHFVDWFGWRWAFAPLAVGPFLGVWAMLALRAMPASERLAGGRR